MSVLREWWRGRGRWAILFLCAACSTVLGAPKPNFILIFADDQGYEDLGCYGSKRIKTPHLDRLAKEGLRFTDFYAQPICGPSRAALMTGCYPQRVAERGNVKNIHPHLHGEEITIAEVLKPQGYVSGCFGKWDLGKHSQRGFHKDLQANDQGFDYFFGTPTSNDGFVDLYRNRELIEEKAPMATLTKRYTDEAIAFMERHKEKPFFVYLPHTMPHTRLAASAQFAGKSPRGLYGDVIEEIDFNVGRIVEAVKRLQLEKNTYLIYTSDNGPWLIKNRNFVDGDAPKDHGGSAGVLRSGKVSTWEGGVRVPALAWAPGRIEAGRVSSDLVTTMDILPTFAQLAGAKVPDDRVIDGSDFSWLLHGEAAEQSPDVRYYYYFLTHLQAVRQGPWKLVLARPKDPRWLGPHAKNRHIDPRDDDEIAAHQLYNLVEDIGESKDVSAAHPEVTARLLKLVEAAREDIGDYDRIGKGVRFFDPMKNRPGRPVTPWAK